MQSKKSGRAMRNSFAVLASVLAMGTVTSAMAQPAPAKPAAAATPAAPAKPADAKPAAAPAKPADAKPAAPAKPLTEAQKKDAAKEAYKGAEGKFEKADYAGALELYKKADEMVPGAAPKYKIAVCTDKLGKVKDAVAAYAAFLAASPDPEKFKDKIADATSRKDALEKTPAKVKVAIIGPDNAAGATFMVDGAAQAGPELTMAPGKHKVSAQAPGFDMATQDVEVTFADQKDLSITLTKSAAPPPVAAVTPPPMGAPTETPAAPPEAPAKSEPRSKVPAYVTLGLAGAGAVVGTIFGIQAMGSKSDYEANPSQELFDDTERNALLADMSFGVAITFGVTGAVLLFSDRGEAKGEATPPTKTATQKPVVLPYVSPDGAGAAATLRF